MDILILNFIIFNLKIDILFWNLLFNFKKLIWSRIWYLNFELLFWNLKFIF